MLRCNPHRITYRQGRIACERRPPHRRRTSFHKRGSSNDCIGRAAARGAQAHATLRAARCKGRANGIIRGLPNAYPLLAWYYERAPANAAHAGLFDVSHMGQIALRPRNGNLLDVAIALERLVPIDVLGLAAGRQRYAFITNVNGGVIDDLMIVALRRSLCACCQRQQEG